MTARSQNPRRQPCAHSPAASPTSPAASPRSPTSPPPCAVRTAAPRSRPLAAWAAAGKTTLAIEAAWRMAGRFPDGILYIDMLGFGTAPPLTPAQAIAAVIEQLEPTAKLPERLDQLLPLHRRLLVGRKLLLLLDNARDTAQVADLVPPPPVALLVTSRHQILLDGGTRLDLDVMPLEEARTLLRGIVGDRRATDAELDRLAERCGRLPLALRAAGTYLQFRAGLKIADYLKLLATEQTRLDHLKVSQTGRDVRATLNLSAALLDAGDPLLGIALAPARRVPVGVSAGRCRCSLVCARVGYGRIARSTGVALAARLPETNRYRLHDLVPTAAGEALDAAVRLEFEGRHAEHYCGHWPEPMSSICRAAPMCSAAWPCLTRNERTFWSGKRGRSTIKTRMRMLRD